jgi:hypothetical protein
MNSINKTARLAGFLYLMYIATSIIADRFGRLVFVEAPVTLNRILIHESEFRVGFVVSLFSVVFLFLAAWALYMLLKPANEDVALLFLVLNLTGLAMWCLGLLNLSGSLLLLSGADYLKVFRPDQLQALAMFFINLYKNGSIIAQVPYGIWLLPLGYLVIKSRFLPRLLGILLIADCLGLLAYVFQRFLLPDYGVLSYPCLAISFIAEASLTLWLLIKGANEKD